MLVILAVAGGIAWTISRARHAAPAAHRGGRFALNGAMPVSTVAVKKGNIDIVLTALGTVTPLATVTVRPQIAGQLMQVAFHEGQTVKAGNFLAQIDPRPYQLALAQAQGNLQRDEALLKGAQTDLDRYTQLMAQDSIARQQLDAQKTLVQQYAGVVQTDQAQVAAANLNLAYCRITAPISGRLGLRQVDPGNYVQTNDATGLAVITQLQPISVLFPLPEDDLPAVMKRVSAGATLPVAALDRGETATLDIGRLTTVDNQIDPATGTVKLRARFDNAKGALFANQFVNIRLLVDTIQDAIVIPSAAVQRGAPGTFVYVVKPDDTVALQAVTLGPASGDNVSVTAGLAPGQVIVSDGADKLKDGAKVAIPGQAAAPTAAPENAGAAGQAGQHRHRKRSQ